MSDEFYNAAVYGDMVKLRSLLGTNPYIIHSKTKWGFTAIHGVASEEHFETAEFLIKQGANPNAKNDDGITPLHLGAYPEMVQLLFRLGADLNVRSNDGSTPLIIQAAEAEGYDVMEALLELGADVNAKDLKGRSALDFARRWDEEDKVELLKEYGAE